jgi:hypothetical protein
MTFGIPVTMSLMATFNVDPRAGEQLLIIYTSI